MKPYSGFIFLYALGILITALGVIFIPKHPTPQVTAYPDFRQKPYYAVHVAVVHDIVNNKSVADYPAAIAYVVSQPGDYITREFSDTPNGWNIAGGHPYLLLMSEDGKVRKELPKTYVLPGTTPPQKLTEIILVDSMLDYNGAFHLQDGKDQGTWHSAGQY